VAEIREDEVVECLTNEGDIPITYCFVHGGGVNYWNPHLRCVMHKVFRDQSFALACIRYLQARGLVCDTQEDFPALADRYRWRDWGLPPPDPFA
jgi:hypothetical protein